MENRELQNRFLQPIKDSDRQGDRNPRVFLKAKVIQASSQLNPDRDKIFQFSGQSPLNPNFGQANFAQQFRFGAQDYLTPDLNSSQNRSGADSSIFNSPFSSSVDFRSGSNITAANLSSLPRTQANNKWSANLAGFGSPEAQFCLNSHLSLEHLCQTTLEDFGKLDLLEKILALLRINHVTPLGFSQQYEAQQSLPEKVFYVEGCWRCCLIFNVEATLRAHQEEWLSVEIRVCPPRLLGQVRQALPCSPAAVPWLSCLQAIAEDPTESSRGLLGYFSSTQMDLIESLFVSMGEPDPWGSIINPIWAAHLLDVEEAWVRATEPYQDLTTGELSISPQLYQTEAPLEDVLTPPQLVESLVSVIVSPVSEEPQEHELVLPQPEALLADVLTPPQLVESLARVLVSPAPEEPPESVLSRPQTEALPETGYVEMLPGDPRSVLVEEEPSERLWLSPFQLLFDDLDVLGRFPLTRLFPTLPSWSRSKWWSVFSHHASHVLHRALHSTHDTTGVTSSVLLPLRYQTKVMTSLCGLLAGSSSPGGGTRVPFYLVGDVVAY